MCVCVCVCVCVHTNVECSSLCVCVYDYTNEGVGVYASLWLTVHEVYARHQYNIYKLIFAHGRVRHAAGLTQSA
jgi:hypothetical protein